MNIPIANFISRKKITKKKKNNKKEKRGGHMMKCLLTELGRAGRENIWPSVMAHAMTAVMTEVMTVRHDLGPNIFPSGPPTQSISISSYDQCLILSKTNAPLRSYCFIWVTNRSEN